LPGICSYGVNFHRISKDLLLFGFIVQGAKLNQAQHKALKQNHRSVVSPEMIERILSTIRTSDQSLVETKAAAIARFVEEYRNSSMYKTELLNLLKPEIQKNLAFLHDYKQFVARVKQNINVVLQDKFPEESIDAQLQKATRAEAAIYWSAALMDDKLQTAFLLMNPDRLSGAEKTQFRLHGFILKHLRIYQAAFDEKEVRVIQNGHSTGEVTASQAFAVIPHTLLDNALKYSSRGCQVVISFRENKDSIDFSVTSHGPKIEELEKNKIFEPFYRGSNGIAQQEEGSGVGLYLAQFVARDLGTEIKMTQSSHKTKCGYETTFSVCLRRTR
jgi:signal transduction histidine kinase